jgi:glutamate dehydrogenase (NAD(P)+)
MAVHPGRLLAGYETLEADKIDNHELLTSDVDVLIPAALEHQIHAENAPYIRAETIIEAANGPTTPEADEILNDRGILVVPDILANAGGVVVSYFEWVQNMQCFFWEEAEVNRHLERIMVQSFEKVWDLIQDKQVSMRLGAYMLAVTQVADAVYTRGIFP